MANNSSRCLLCLALLLGICAAGNAETGDAPTIPPINPSANFPYSPFMISYGVGVGTAFSQTLKVTGGAPPYRFLLASGSLPPGFALNPDTGLVSGTTSVDGYYEAGIQVTDSQKRSAISPVGFAAIGTRPIVMAASLPNATVGQQYEHYLYAAGGKPSPGFVPYYWSIVSGTLPPGIKFGFIGAHFSGLTTSTGLYSVTVRVYDSLGATSDRTLSIAVVTVGIVTTSLPNGTVGKPYQQALTASNGFTPLTWTIAAGALPPGLSLSSAGVISGTPTTPLSATFTARVTDVGFRTASQVLNLKIEPPIAPLTISTATLPDSTSGSTYSAPLVASGGVLPYTWSVSLGALPAGLALDSSKGILGGTPSQVGAFPLTVQVRDSAGTVATQRLTLTVLPSRMPVVSSIVNGASFGSSGFAAPGSILSIFCSNLGTNEQLSAFPSTNVSGVSVAFNGTQVPIFAVVPSQNQINVLAPDNLQDSGVVNVVVTTPTGISTAYPLQMQPARPGIFGLVDPSDRSRRYGLALLANTSWLAIPSAVAAAVRIPTNCSAEHVSVQSICGQPLAGGDIAPLYLTGLGKATPGGDPRGSVLVTGQVAPANGSPLYQLAGPLSITVDGVPADILFSGLAPAYAGLFQANFRIPGLASAGDRIQVRVVMPNGTEDSALIAIRAK